MPYFEWVRKASKVYNYRNVTEFMAASNLFIFVCCFSPSAFAESQRNVRLKLCALSGRNSIFDLQKSKRIDTRKFEHVSEKKMKYDAVSVSGCHSVAASNQPAALGRMNGKNICCHNIFDSLVVLLVASEEQSETGGE